MVSRWFARLRRVLHRPSPPDGGDEESLPLVTDDAPNDRDLLAKVDEETHALLFDAGVAVQIGYLRTFHETKRHLLRTKYGLRWEPPDIPG